MYYYVGFTRTLNLDIPPPDYVIFRFLLLSISLFINHVIRIHIELIISLDSDT